MYGKVKSWCLDTELLSQVTVSQPHAVFVGYVHTWTSKWSYISRTILGIGHLLEPLEQVVRDKFIPVMTGHPSSSENECSLLVLPAIADGMGLTIPPSNLEFCYEASSKITVLIATMIAIKSSVRKAKCETQLTEADAIYSELLSPQLCLMECAREQCASLWVFTLPINEHRFLHTPGEFSMPQQVWLADTYI